MEQNITTELLSVIYKRAMVYCIAAYGKDGNEPDELRLKDDGSFEAVWVPHYATCISEWEIEYFTIDKLTDDLDKVYAERKAREAESARKRQIEREKREQERIDMEKSERRQQYEKLKKEFE